SGASAGAAPGVAPPPASQPPWSAASTTTATSQPKPGRALPSAVLRGPGTSVYVEAEADAPHRQLVEVQLDRVVSCLAGGAVVGERAVAGFIGTTEGGVDVGHGPPQNRITQVPVVGYLDHREQVASTTGVVEARDEVGVMDRIQGIQHPRNVSVGHDLHLCAVRVTEQRLQLRAGFRPYGQGTVDEDDPAGERGPLRRLVRDP